MADCSRTRQGPLTISTDQSKMHLVVLIHGMWGNISHFDYIVEQFVRSGAASHDSGPVPDLQGVKTVVYRASSNQGYFTYDGVDICGLRVADEIKAEITAIGNTGTPVTEISILGYSMGGIIARYAIGVLEKEGLFDSIKTRAFTTMFSPHLGVRVLNRGYAASAFNFIGSWSMARTSRQVFLQDNYHNLGVPLFLYLTTKGSPYVDALERFESRTLYANIVNDRRCEFYTAAAQTSDPYTGKQALLEGPYIEGYGPTLLSPREPRFGTVTPAQKKASLIVRLITALTLPFKVAIGVPVWFCAFLINAAFQTSLSALRASPIISSGRLLPAEGSSYTGLDKLLEVEAGRIVEHMYSVVDTPSQLHVSPEISLIKKQFDQLVWNRVYVHITADKNAHAAAIHRWDTPSFHEGKLVIKHWIKEVLKL